MKDIVLPIQPVERTHRQIERQLRSLIQQGKLAAGERLPATQQMAKQWKVSSTTVQQALVHLTADGLLERRPRAGTFVKAATDRAVIGILMATPLADETAYFYRAVLNAFHSQMGQREWAGRVYDGLRIEEITEYGKQQRRHLSHDLRNYNFKGLIEFGIQTNVLSEIHFDPALPKVCLHLDKARADVVLDEYQFGHATVEHVAQAGRRKILYLRNSISGEGADLDGMWDAVRQRDLPAPQIVTLPGSRGHDLEKQAFEETSRLLGSRSDETPSGPMLDALIVADDIAMRGVALALVRERINVPNQLLVLTHANHGIKLHYGLPVVRYEYSPAEMARVSLNILWKRIAGQPTPKLPICVRGQLVGAED